MLLIADSNILYGSRIYKAGDKLPAADSRLLTAWLKNGFAHWEGEISEEKEENLSCSEEKPQEKEENLSCSEEKPQESTESTETKAKPVKPVKPKQERKK